MRKKVLDLKFDKGTPIDEIKTELLYYQKNGVIGRIVINGVLIHYDCDDLNAEIFKAMKGLSNAEYLQIKKLEEITPSNVNNF